jgi:hypothetical protein
MKIALLISGKSVSYEKYLIPLLEKSEYDIDVFVSVNDNDGPYYDELKKKLDKWLKGIYINRYKLPENFENNGTVSRFLKIGRKCGEIILEHSMSCYFNDNHSYNMATNYADENNINYDIYIRFRSDIISDKLPELKIRGDTLFCVTPVANFNLVHDTNPKYFNKPVTGDIAYGSRNAMKIYCNTYDYVIEKNKYNNDLFISFECCLTMNILDNCENFEFFKYSYYLDPLRKKNANLKEDLVKNDYDCI